MIRVGIVGASGYAGGEIARLLLGHREASIVRLTSRSHVGKAAFEVYPGLRGYTLPRFTDPPGSALARECDVVFVAAPPGAAAAVAREVLEASSDTRIIDVGPDFRLRDPSLYHEWYGMVHEAPELLSEAVYGLPELYREEIRSARIVANPGCYPTAALLALAPLVAWGYVDLGTIVIDAKSGVSGAGRTPSTGYHFPECDENLRPYRVVRHRHTPEIEQELQRLSRSSQDGVRGPAGGPRESRSADGGDLVVTFTPHLIPMSRGILVTAYAALKDPARSHGDPSGDACARKAGPGPGGSSPGEIGRKGGGGCGGGRTVPRERWSANGVAGVPPDPDQGALTALYEDFYAGERFVRVLREDLPQTKAVRGSNFCDIAVRVDPRTRRVIAMSALDNLVKGAAGQAIQNMNILFGLEESMGLETPPVWP